MLRKSAIALTALFLCLLAFSNTATARDMIADETTIVVTPTRYAVFQLAWDVSRLRPVTLVAYEEARRNKPGSLNVMTAGRKRWQKISMNDYASGAAFPFTPRRVIILGDDSALVGKLEAASSWGKGVRVMRIPLSSIVGMINSLHDCLRFTSAEWRTLASWNNLKLQDKNIERRRYGRWGADGDARRLTSEPEPEERAQEKAPALDEQEEYVEPVQEYVQPVNVEPIEEAAPDVPPTRAPRSEDK